MEQSRFFTWVWRFNGIAIALLTALGVVGLLGAFGVLPFGRSERPEPVVEPLDAAGPPLQLSGLRDLPNEGLLVAELTSPDERSSFGSGSGSYLNTLVRNLVFFDLSKGEGRRLLANDGSVIARHFFPRSPLSNREV